MLIGYVRVSKADGSQTHDLQRDALIAAGVDVAHIYEDRALGKKLRLAMASMGKPETKVSILCQELGITRQTLYRHLSPDGQLRSDGIKLLSLG